MIDGSKKSTPIGNFSKVFSGRVVAAGLSAIFYLVFAALLEPDAFGELAFIIAIANTFAVVSRFGLNFTVEVYQGKKNSELANQLNILAFILILSGSIVLLFIDPLLSLLAFVQSFFVMEQGNLLGQNRYKKFRNLTIIRSISLVIIPIILYQFLEIPGIILGMSIANFVSTYNFVKRLRRGALSLNRIRNRYKVILHNFGVASSSSLNRSLDKLVIVPVLGFATVGIYQFDFQILAGLGVLPVAIHSFFLAEESRGKRNTKLGYFLVLASILIVAIVFFVADPLVEWLFPHYSEGILSLKIMSISIIPLSISAILYAKLQAKESTQIGYSAIIRIGSLLLLLVILGNALGLLGLSLAVLISTIFNIGFLLFLFLKSSHQ